MNPIDSTATVITNLQSWAAQPFQTSMDLGHWFLWVGVVIVMVVAWTLIIHELEITL